jgi:putative GTP pyrophosphokinase
MTRKEVQSWLREALPRHERLTAAVVSLLENILTKRDIEFLSITGRTKSASSALEKNIRKNYRDPRTQLTDLSGVRVITFLEDQVTQISKVIRDTFEVDEKNSLDRSAILGHDRMGYRSTHFVCTIGKDRASLPEYDNLSGLKFEVQVRTVLQHAWAELAHDRSFKLGLELPEKMERKLNLYAGMLEIVDGAFDEIAKEIDLYAHAINRKPSDQLSEAEVDSISLKKYLRDVAQRYDLKIRPGDIASDVVGELRAFGLPKIGDLQELITASKIKEIKAGRPELNGNGFLRALMMYEDLEKYFKFQRGWGVIGKEPAKGLAKRYGAKKVAKIFSEHDISVRDESDEEFYDGTDDIEKLLRD